MTTLWQELWDERNIASDASPIIPDLWQLFSRTGFASQPICSAAGVDYRTTITGIEEAKNEFQQLPRQGFYNKIFQAEIALNDRMTKNKIRVRTLNRQATNDEAVDVAILGSLARRALEAEQLPIWRRALCHVLLAICYDVDTQMQLRGAQAMLSVAEHEMFASAYYETREFNLTLLHNMAVIKILETFDELCVSGGEMEIDIEWWMLDAHEYMTVGWITQMRTACRQAADAVIVPTEAEVELRARLNDDAVERDNDSHVRDEAVLRRE